MNAKFKDILLIDDNEADNFLNEYALKEMGCTDTVYAVKSGPDALKFLRARQDEGLEPPELIFLDINMPGMNGWEFLEAYEALNSGAKTDIVIVMLSTSLNPDDQEKAAHLEAISDFKNKPITEEKMMEIVKTFFPEKL